MGAGQLPKPRLDALPCGAHRLLCLTDEALFKACGVRVLFTGREGGVSEGCYASLNCGKHVGDDDAAVERNRAIVKEALGAADAPLIVPSQVHGTHLVTVRPLQVECSSCHPKTGMALLPPSRDSVDGAGDVARAQEEAAAGADGIVVKRPGVAALLNFADCLPVIIVSPSGSFAVAHAGWRGAVAHIAKLAVDELAAGDEFAPHTFNAYIGPHIRSECFEVGEEVAQQFAQEFGLEVLTDKRHVSLADAVTLDLQAAGLPSDRIDDAGICTKCHPDQYFSYRATDGKCGRHAAAAFTA